MTALFSGYDLMYLTGGRVAAGSVSEQKGPICSDIRALKPGDWFLALIDDENDGHDFIAVAMQKGALGCIVENRTRYPFAGNNANLIAVTNTLQAYQAIARAWRYWTKPLVIAVAESGDRLALQQLCSSTFRDVRTYTFKHELKDEIDIPKAILDQPEHTQLMLLEMEPHHRGALAALSYMARPDIAIITGDSDNSPTSIKCKCELLEGLDEIKGLAIVIGDNQPLIERARQVFSGQMHIVQSSKVQQTLPALLSESIARAEQPSATTPLTCL